MIHRLPILLMILSISACGAATSPQAPDTPAARHDAVIAHLKKLAADISARSLPDVQTSLSPDWRARARRDLLYSLGLDPLPRRTPLEAKITGTVRRPGFRVEKIFFQSLPRLYVTANFYLPDPTPPAPSKLPTILYVCGHAPDPAGAKVQYQDRGPAYARRGYACLIVDTLEFGEVAGLHHGIHDLNRWDWLSRGYTPAGVEVWNAIRALDYLETRPEVDPRRIGITGISGGGVITWMTAAVDERVAAAASVCGVWTFGTQAAHWRASGQCDCIYFHNTFLADLPTAAALIAPRPLMICGGQKDADFPPDGYREVYEKLRPLYATGQDKGDGADRLRLVDEDVPHTDSPLFRREARQWMDRWLNSDVSQRDDAGADPADEVKKLAAGDLACLPEPPPDAINDRIDTLFIPTVPFDPASYPSLEKWDQRRRDVLAGLKDKVFRAFPRDRGGERLPFNERTTRNTGGWAARYADYSEVFIDSEAGVPIRLQVLRPKDEQRRRSAPVLIYAKRAGDSIYAMDLDELLPVLGRATVIILNPRLTEHPVTAFERAEIERSASWVGRTIASMQVWDILRTVEWAARPEKDGQGKPQLVTLYGKGDMAALALYAGLLDERVVRVVLSDPPATHRSPSAPGLLNVLRVTDLPEAAAAFAPRRLLFVPEVPAAYEPALKIYALHERAGELMTAGSLTEALAR
jgi:dienelactone hydrolase